MPKNEKLDLYKKHKSDYVTPKTPQLVTIKPANYLTIAGKGEPGGEAFQAKLGGLYGAAYTLKFTSKALGRDYGVCKLEGLWWGRRKIGDFSKEPMSTWNWKLVIRTPDFLKKKDLAEAVKALKEKGKSPEVAEVELETLKEGRCVQVLHVGPYSEEGRSMAAMSSFVAENGLKFNGIHHEIYLSDPRRVAPERLKTILRMPVA